jgi:hypothetical protein
MSSESGGHCFLEGDGQVYSNWCILLGVNSMFRVNILSRANVAIVLDAEIPRDGLREDLIQFRGNHDASKTI